MTGFKDGSSGDDPFSSESTDSEAEVETSSGGSGQQLAEPEPEPEPEPEESMDSTPSNGLPWIYKRDSISDGRSTVQLHLQDSTLEKESDVKRTVRSHFGESVPKADLREAALLVGLAHTDELEDVLRNWGYDFE